MLAVLFATACSLGLLLASCGDPDGSRILPAVEKEAGLEVATLATLPSPLDPEWLWSFRTVREVRTVSAGSDRPLVFDPGSVLQLRDGLLLVHDPMATEPLVLIDPSTETAVARFGRAGGGPGEIGGDVALSESADGSFVVADRANLQMHRYARSGEWLGSERLDPGGWPMSSGTQPGPREGQFLMMRLNQLQGEPAPWYELVEVDARSGSSKLFLRFPEPLPARAGEIQSGRRLWTVLPGHVVTMWSSEPTIMVHDGDGRPLRRIGLPLTQSRLTARDIEREVARVGGLARSLEPGPRALTNMLYTAGDSVFGMFLSNLWRAAEDPPLQPGTIYWRLFTLRGEYLGVVEQPAHFLVRGRGEGTIWARLLDGAGYPLLAELELVKQTPESP